MKIVSKHPVLVGTAFMVLATGALYGCKDFLSNAATPQGTLNEGTLANRVGVEGTLIGAYRTLDCTNATRANWGCAASNWVWGTVAADDAYKGSDGTDQPPINDIEGYHWGTPDAETYLNTKWGIVYEGDRMWGNIPYYTEDETDFRKANGTPAEAITNILKDLDAAIADLPTSPRNGNVGRATQWTAKAYKGRGLMYAQLYPAALTALKEVVNSGPYALETS